MRTIHPARLSWAPAILLALLVQGCSGMTVFRDTPLKQARKMARAPLQSVTPVQVPGGTLTFYRWVRANECGRGYVFDVNGASSLGGGSAGPCSAREPLGVSCEAGAGGNNPFGVCHGEVSDPRIASVTVMFEGEVTPIKAQVINGFWCVFLPGQRRSPALVRADGLDARGQTVVQYRLQQP